MEGILYVVYATNTAVNGFYNEQKANAGKYSECVEFYEVQETEWPEIPEYELKPPRGKKISDVSSSLAALYKPDSGRCVWNGNFPVDVSIVRDKAVCKKSTRWFKYDRDKL
jgi:hypothetical protein